MYHVCSAAKAAGFQLDEHVHPSADNVSKVSDDRYGEHEKLISDLWYMTGQSSRRISALRQLHLIYEKAG